MKPETVLNLRAGDDPTARRDEWLAAYHAYPDDSFTQALCRRAELACSLLTSNSNKSRFWDKLTGKTYERQCELLDRDDCRICNERDAAFANCFFTVSELAAIQLGCDDDIETADNPARQGFLLELNGDVLAAADRYRQADSPVCMERATACQMLAAEEGDRLYRKGMALIEKDHWHDAYIPILRAAGYGHRGATGQLGVMYIYGKGCIENREQGLLWLRRSAEAGNEIASRLLDEVTEQMTDGKES